MPDYPNLHVIRAHNKAVEAIKKIDDGHEDLRESIESMDLYFESPYMKGRPKFNCSMAHYSACPTTEDQTDEFNMAHPPSLMQVLEDCTCEPMSTFLRSMITMKEG